MGRPYTGAVLSWQCPDSPVWRLQLTRCHRQNSSCLGSCPLKGKNSDKRHRAVFSSKTFIKQSERMLLRKQECELSGNQSSPTVGVCVCAQSCLTLGNPMDCGPPGSSVHGILQARILEWVAISFSRDLPDPGFIPGSLALQADFLLTEPQGKPPYHANTS